jgi:tetratricopeptide (TPR) repeat protein
VGLYFHRWAAALAALCLPALAAPDPPWRLIRNDHFEIYVQSSEQRAREILTWFEQLRAFFQQQGGLETVSPQAVRVIVFASSHDYEPYRLRPAADAYYVGAGNQDYIVMGTDDPVKFGQAAHEYAHLVLRASNLQLPPWLKEGLAEFFATLRITEHATELGGVLPGRLRTLQREPWMPLSDLMSIPEESHRREERGVANLFYSESWALTEMLVLSPDYAPGFQKFVARVASGTSGLEALTATYAKSAQAVTRDLHVWVGQRTPPVIQLPEVIAGAVPADLSDVSLLAVRLLLAQVLLAAGEFDRASAFFSELSLASSDGGPESAGILAGLAMIALHKGDSEGARRAWKRAIQQGFTDANLCYRYAILADQAGLPAEDIRPALERAIALQPDFDDARYQLGLLEKNARHFDSALQQFQAMRIVAEARAYAYWFALADTFNELGRRDEAQSAAQHATEHASTAAERDHAAKEIYIAQTDPSVQFARDASGHLQLVTTRMPHQKSDWNPFIEPGDDVHRVEGTLVEVDCANVTTIRLEAAGKLFTLAIPDLQHVQMRHAPPEFTCGPQNPTASVIVDYAATGDIVRGIDFQ